MSDIEQKKVTASLIDQAQSSQGMISARFDDSWCGSTNSMIDPMCNGNVSGIDDLSQGMINLDKRAHKKR
jgi:hypothetical protein